MKVLGIDPGSTRIGYALIEKNPELKAVEYGVIEMPDAEGFKKILLLGERLTELIVKFNPALAGVEKLFFAKNRKTALEVSEALGVIMYILAKHKIPVREFRPNEVKQALTNYSFADKRAVAHIVKKVLKLDELTGYDDASDALAIAITAAYNQKLM